MSQLGCWPVLAGPASRIRQAGCVGDGTPAVFTGLDTQLFRPASTRPKLIQNGLTTNPTLFFIFFLLVSDTSYILHRRLGLGVVDDDDDDQLVVHQGRPREFDFSEKLGQLH